MGWDRHKYLWDGTDKYIPWTTLPMPRTVLLVGSQACTAVLTNFQVYC